MAKKDNTNLIIGLVAVGILVVVVALYLSKHHSNGGGSGDGGGGGKAPAVGALGWQCRLRGTTDNDYNLSEMCNPGSQCVSTRPKTSNVIGGPETFVCTSSG